MQPPIELTLIVAATRSMGIGHQGTLPWTGLKKEMAYFARVTKRLPSTATPASSSPLPARNAVIMGRKTWESIPPRFRPLPGRLNVVISRSAPSTASSTSTEQNPIEAPSLDQAIERIRSTGGASDTKVFVIGGAQIYAAALERPDARRVLLTRVKSDFECDTFFSLVLGQEGGVPAPQGGKWVRRSKAELDAWVGETVPEGVIEENDTRYEFEMWERVD